MPNRNDAVADVLLPALLQVPSAALEPFLPALRGEEPLHISIRQESPTSIHLVATVEMRCNGSVARFFAKADWPCYCGPQSLQREAEVLRELAPRITAQNPALCSPTLLSYVRGHEMLLEENVSGPSLKGCLFGPLTQSPQPLPRLLELTGEWLGRFHAITRLTEQGNPLDWLAEKFHSSKVSTAFAACALQREHAELLVVIDKIRQACPDLQRNLCQVHGEFTALHVLVNRERVYVIDFASGGAGFSFADLGLFLAFYDGLLPWRTLLGSQRLDFARQRDIFLSAYAAHAGTAFTYEDFVALRLARLAALAELEGCWEKPAHSALQALRFRTAQLYVRPRFRHIVEKELAALAEARGTLHTQKVCMRSSAWEDIQCPLCDLRSPAIAMEENGFLGRRCSGCGLVYISPRPPAGEIQDLYMCDKAHIQPDSHIQRSFLKRLFARHTLKLMAPHVTSGSILEIGAGAGYFLDEARKAGFQPYAVELNPRQADFIEGALGIPCERQLFSTASFGRKKFDVIYHADVTSHFLDPLQVFREIAEKLADNGFVVFETGNFADVAPRYLPAIPCLQYPDHLFFFGQRSLHKLLQAAGFEVIRMHAYPVLVEYRMTRLIKRLKQLKQRHRPAAAAVPAPKHDAGNGGHRGLPGRVRGVAEPVYHRFLHFLRYGLSSALPKSARPQTVIVIARKKKMELRPSNDKSCMERNP